MFLTLSLEAVYRQSYSCQLEMTVSYALYNRRRIYVVLAFSTCPCSLLLKALLDEL